MVKVEEGLEQDSKAHSVPLRTAEGGAGGAGDWCQCEGPAPVRPYKMSPLRAHVLHCHSIFR